MLQRENKGIVAIHFSCLFRRAPVFACAIIANCNAVPDSGSSRILAV